MTGPSNGELTRAMRSNGEQPDATNSPALISVPDAARILGISAWSYYARAREGALPFMKMGRRVVVPVAALERILEG